MEDENFTQDHFINEDGYINIKLKVTTENKIEREKIISKLMYRVKHEKGFDLPKNTLVSDIYFKNQDPLTILERLKEELTESLQREFNNAIEVNKA